MAQTRRALVITEAQHEMLCTLAAQAETARVYSGGAVRTLQSVRDALAQAPVAEVVVVLTRAEARGLDALAGEGAEGLLTDESAGRGYLGNNQQRDAARRGLDKLADAAALKSGRGAQRR